MAAQAEAHKTEPLLGRGIDDVVDVARIVWRRPETVLARSDRKITGLGSGLAGRLASMPTGRSA